MKKTMGFMLLVLVVVLAACFGFVHGGNDAKIVFDLPPGFVSLDEEMTLSKDALSYVFWESQISFLDTEGTCIYQTSVKNDKFIVKYKGEYYINESE
jgi:hypothetical protein